MLNKVYRQDSFGAISVEKRAVRSKQDEQDSQEMQPITVTILILYILLINKTWSTVPSDPKLVTCVPPELSARAGAFAEDQLRLVEDLLDFFVEPAHV